MYHLGLFITIYMILDLIHFEIMLIFIIIPVLFTFKELIFYLFRIKSSPCVNTVLFLI